MKNIQSSDRPATRLTFLERRCFGPRYSPDGEKIVFTAVGRKRCDIYLMNADGSGLQCLTPGEGQYHDPVFSPDGVRIAYVACHPIHEEIRNIHVMNQDGTEPQALTTTNMESHPDFSRDGKYIAFVSGRDRSLEIYRMQADGNDQQRLTFVEDSPEQRVGPAPRNRSPVHTPDGESIMFVCLPIGPSQHPEHGNRLVLQPGQIHRIQNNGTERQALVTLEGGCDDPQFSPDGTWLAFRNQAQRRSSNDGPSCICLSRPDGSGLMRLRGSYGMCESFHPEGNRIVFASCRDRRFEPARRNWDLYCIDVQDGELQRLSDNEAFDNCPVFSPGGSRILFCSDREGYEELYTMPYGE